MNRGSLSLRNCRQFNKVQNGFCFFGNCVGKKICTIESTKLLSDIHEYDHFVKYAPSIGTGECIDTLTSLKTRNSSLWGIHSLGGLVSCFSVLKLEKCSSSLLNLSVEDFRKVPLARVSQAKCFDTLWYIFSYDS